MENLVMAAFRNSTLSTARRISKHMHAHMLEAMPEPFDLEVISGEHDLMHFCETKMEVNCIRQLLPFLLKSNGERDLANLCGLQRLHGRQGDGIWDMIQVIKLRKEQREPQEVLAAEDNALAILQAYDKIDQEPTHVDQAVRLANFGTYCLHKRLVKDVTPDTMRRVQVMVNALVYKEIQEMGTEGLEQDHVFWMSSIHLKSEVVLVRPFRRVQ